MFVVLVHLPIHHLFAVVSALAALLAWCCTWGCRALSRWRRWASRRGPKVASLMSSTGVMRFVSAIDAIVLVDVRADRALRLQVNIWSIRLGIVATIGAYLWGSTWRLLNQRFCEEGIVSRKLTFLERWLVKFHQIGTRDKFVSNKFSFKVRNLAATLCNNSIRVLIR